MIYRNQCPYVDGFDWEALEDWLKSCVESYGFLLIELQLKFLKDTEIQLLNKKHLGHDYITDIITFDYSRGANLRVEEYIGVEEVFRYAKENAVTIERELGRVMVHGLLHCMGYKDHTEHDRAVMRSAEEDCLTLLRLRLR